MSGPRALRATLLVAAVAALVLTRLPHHGTVWTAATALLALAVLALGLAWLFGTGRPWTRPALVAGGLLLLLVPTSPAAALGLPAALVALLVLAAVLALQETEAGRAPPLPGQTDARQRRLARALPLLLVLAAVAVAAAVLPLVLPDRVGSLYELRAATAPLATLAVLAAALLGAVWLRDGLAREPKADEVEA